MSRRRRKLLLYDLSNLNSHLALWLDSSDTTTITKTYQNLAATGSGVSTTKIITASTDQTNLIQPGEKLRIGGTDIYTVASIATTTITTVEVLINNYVAQPMALDRISQWNDKSGNGYNATQGTASKQPVYNAGQLNGKSVLDFNGSNTLVLPSGVYSIPNGANTSFFVAKRNSESGFPARIVAIDQSTNFKYLLTYGATSGDALFGNTNTASFATLPGNINTNYQIITGKYDGGTGLYVQSNNGTPATNLLGMAVNTADNSYIGSAGDINRYLLGSIAEIRIYNCALSAGEILYVNTLLKSKYGIL